MQNQKEFIAIIKENQGLILKVTKISTGNKEDEQDLYQEIVYQLWKSFPSFKNDAKISTWMYRVALNTSITHLKKEKKKGIHIPVDDELLNRTDAKDSLVEEQLEILYEQIKKLNAADKAVVFLYLEGNTYEEIAAITGFSSTNVGTRLGRIKQKLISQIKK